MKKQDELNKMADTIKHGFRSAYDEISKSINTFADKANKGAKEIALKLELPSVEKNKRAVLEKIGELIYNTKDVVINDAVTANKLGILIADVKTIEKEIAGINAEISQLSKEFKKKSAPVKKKTVAKKAPAKKKIIKKTTNE